MLELLQQSQYVQKYQIEHQTRLIAEMAIIPSNIKIDYKTMRLNITKSGWSADEGTYGLKNLFHKNNACYCSADKSGNCVDLLLDLGSEFTFTAFEAWSTSRHYTCPLQSAYLWIFPFRNRTAEQIKNVAKQLHAKQKFDELETKYTYIDPQTKERRRDELVPVSYVYGDLDSRNRSYHWKMKTGIAEYIRGRYVLIKLIATAMPATESEMALPAINRLKKSLPYLSLPRWYVNDLPSI
jgi:hypothetical protein